MLLFRRAELNLGGVCVGEPHDFIRTSGILRSELEADEEWVLGLFWGAGPSDVAVVCAPLSLRGVGSFLTRRQIRGR